LSKHTLITQRDLLKNARDLFYPLSIPLPAGDILQLTESLRVIPRKRITARGTWQGKDIIAKVFFKPRKAAYYAERDRIGVNSLLQAGVTTPNLYYAGASQVKGVHVLIFEFIDNATSLAELWEHATDPKAQLRLLVKTIHGIAKQHNVGLLQMDMHTGNFIFSSGRVYSLDGDAIKRVTRRKRGLRLKAGLKNLAALIAQMSFVHEVKTQHVFGAYCNSRNYKPSGRYFLYFEKQIAKQAQRLRRKILEKTLRECSSFVVRSSFTLRAIWSREQSKTDLPVLLPVLEQKVKQQPPAEEIYKTHGYECVKLPSENRALVVKRYALRHLYEGFWHALGFSKAKKAWVNSHSLNLIRVPTIKPIAFCERGLLPWFGKSYLISEFIEGISLNEFVTLNETSTELLADVFAGVALAFQKLARSQITYGDMNARHFLVTKQGVLLTNFDRIKLHRSAEVFERTMQQQLYQFLQNWQDKPHIASLATAAFKQFNLTESFSE
jgi:tRNA A-37 threonylcarbamoyl transferase component Bud32